mmetsp:Transcript_6930/g.19745  ORF Transcript_6930/g.19745 Transcript_6930/m.19745 type:complete len:117 (+) Transcript_6930:170-520(+)
MASRKVIQEEKRFTTSDYQIVDAHRYEVNAHRGMLLRQLSDTKFGSNSICCSDQDGVPRLETGCCKVKKTPEATEVCIASSSTSCLAKWFNQVNKFISGINTDTCVRVTDNFPLGI